MSKLIGRRHSIGIGKESSRGTAVAASYWLPKMTFTFDEKIEQVIDESSIGIIEDSQSADIVHKFGEGEIEGRVNDTSFGLILKATMGTEPAPTLVATGVYDHVFSVLQTAQHPSLTICAFDANDTGARYPLAMVDSLEFTAEIMQYAKYKMNFRSNKGAATSNTPAYSAENIFLPQHGSFKLATTLAGLGAAPVIAVKKVSVTISKNTEDDLVLGSADPTDRLNKQLAVEGSIELMYDDKAYITLLMGDTVRAARITMTNTDVVIGSASNPTITIDLARVKFNEVARKMDNNGLITQTLNFKAHYSIADTTMIGITLRNTLATAY